MAEAGWGMQDEEGLVDYMAGYNSPTFGSVCASTSLPVSFSSRDASPDTNPIQEIEDLSWIRLDTDRKPHFVCLWRNCNNVLADRDELSRHLYTHFEYHCSSSRQTSHWECTIMGCSFSCQTASALRGHLNMHSYHARLMMTGIELLSTLTDYEDAVSCGFPANMGSSFDGQPIFCLWDECRVSFDDISMFFDHTSRHIDFLEADDRVDGKFVCRWSGCSQSCSARKGDLRRHMRLHSGEKHCACPFCGAFFARSEKLYDHMKRKVAEDEKHYTCMLCQKTFCDEGILANHVRRHLSSVQCSICGLATVSPSDLERHMITKHTARQKSFHCTVCSKSFFTKVDVDKHGLTHIPPQLKCTVCDKRFRWKQQLVKHMGTHENLPERPYLCHLCPEKYPAGYGLTRHLIGVHKCPVPEGFSKFLYKKCNDGYLRLQTKKLVRANLV